MAAARVRAMCLALVLAACGGKPLPEWKTSPTPNPSSKRVDRLAKFINTAGWQRSPYSRIDDNLEMPVFLIIADDGTACVAPAEDWTIAQRGDFYPCPGRWRIPR